MVAKAGTAPARDCSQRILRPSCLLFPPLREKWCGRGDSHSHAITRQPLKLLCLLFHHGRKSCLSSDPQARGLYSASYRWRSFSLALWATTSAHHERRQVGTGQEWSWLWDLRPSSPHYQCGASLPVLNQRKMGAQVGCAPTTFSS